MSLINPLNAQDATRIAATPVVRVEPQPVAVPVIEPPKQAPREEAARLDRRHRDRRQQKQEVLLERRAGGNRRARRDDEASEESNLGSSINVRV